MAYHGAGDRPLFCSTCEVIMNVGDVTAVSGCFTKEKFIAGRSLGEIERTLGFHSGRLANGIAVVAPQELPDLSKFDLAAYSQVATHRFQTPTGLNIEKLKIEARASWTITGFERVVKVLPVTRHNASLDPDVQYPPGQGAPQWISRVPLKAKVVAVVTAYPNGRYQPADVARRY